jgi:xanthine dehydrogenase large subunit
MTIAGKPLPHESARGHVTGEALYTDDLLARFPNLLHAWPVTAPHAHARVKRLDAAPALDQPGVVTTLTAADAPGEADSGPSRHDEPIFPREVMFHRQPVAWVLGETLDAAQRGAAQVQTEYEPLPAVLTIQQAIDAGSFLSDTFRLSRGARSTFTSRRRAPSRGLTKPAALRRSLRPSIRRKRRKSSPAFSG